MLFQDAFAAALSDHGVDTIFGLIGDGNLFIIDSWRRRSGRTYIAVAHEASAVEAASGYAQVTGRLGVASVTHGPALTNTITPLIEAVKGRVPLLLIAGDVDDDNSDHPQKIAQREVVAASGAGFESVLSGTTLATSIERAIRRAHLERRPIVLNVPAGLQWTDCDYATRSSNIEDAAIRPSTEAIDRAASEIANAKRPIVLAGRGAITPRARAAVLRFASRIGAPLVTTVKAKDLFHGEPHDFGIIGGIANELTLSTFALADCVVSFGASLNRFTTSEGSLLKDKRLVQIDHDPESFGRFVTPDVRVLGDAGATARELIDVLDEGDVPRSRFAADVLAREIARPAEPVVRSMGSLVDIETAVRRFDDVVDGDRTVVTDSGRFHRAAWPAIRVRDPLHFIHTANFGSIGLGMGTAIGAAVGRPDQPTLLVTGDGGFMLGGLHEFNTAVRNGLDLIVLVLNDGAYGAEHVQFVRRGIDPTLSTFEWPEFGPVAEALGGRGFTVRTFSELEEALAYLPSRDRPVLIDVHTDANALSGVS